jgi:prepilin-type N-terminal cleavage/methylation domain-containing protein
MKRSEAGFTLVELLTVMLLIVLLAAIGVPAYWNQRDKAEDAQAKADARAAEVAALDVSAEKGGRFMGQGGISVLSLRTADPGLEDVDLKVPLRSESSFTIRVESGTGNTFDITRNRDDSTELTCASADRGGCPADGTWD